MLCLFAVVARTPAKTYALLAFIAVSTPLALAVETGLRQLLFPPELEEIRAWLRPTITPWIWVMPALATAAAVAGLWLQRWYAKREFFALPKPERTDAAWSDANFDALMLSTSAPQVPALLATIGFMAGAELPPVIAAIAVGTAGVLVQGVTLGRIARPCQDARTAGGGRCSSRDPTLSA
jgi:hypothetical protein